MSGRMAWGAMPAPRAHGRLAHQVRTGYGQRMLECGASCEQIVRGLGGSPSMASFEVLEGGLLRRL